MLLPDLPSEGDQPETYLVRFLPLDRISPAPENEKLYRPVTADDPKVIELAESIRRFGVLSPLSISCDGFIIAGHRRYKAAQMAGLTKVPCLVEPGISRHEDLAGFLMALKAHNEQRIKTFSEIAREAAMSVNPDTAYIDLVRERERRSCVSATPLDMGEVKVRSKITDAKRPMLNAIVQILNDLRAYWPLSERQIHYNLLNNPPLRHASKPDSFYKNDAKGHSYHDMSDLVTRARLEGRISFEVICDETRPETDWDVHDDVSTFLNQQLNGYLKGYWRDLMQSQPNHIEIICEKNTVYGVLKNLSAEYCIPMTSERGYASIPPRRKIAQRFKKSGKQKLVLIMVTDFDPDGAGIAQSFARSLRDEFELSAEVFPIQAALTLEQINQLNLVSSVDIKPDSKRYKSFVAKYGPDQKPFELEAVPPDTLQAFVREAIDSVIDHEAFEHEQKQERQDVANLAARRAAAIKLLSE